MGRVAACATNRTIAPKAAPGRLRRAMILARLMDTATNSSPLIAAEAATIHP
jgi:hypothetical protein